MALIEGLTEPFFSHTGFEYRFDSPLGVANEEQAKQVDQYIEIHAASPELNLKQAFVPVTTRDDEAWSRPRVSFSRNLRKAPCEYHNGGLWRMGTGSGFSTLEPRGTLIADVPRRWHSL